MARLVRLTVFTLLGLARRIPGVALPAARDRRDDLALARRRSVVRELGDLLALAVIAGSRRLGALVAGAAGVARPAGVLAAPGVVAGVLGAADVARLILTRRAAGADVGRCPVMR
jgi:hypothetical protein